MNSKQKNVFTQKNVAYLIDRDIGLFVIKINRQKNVSKEERMDFSKELAGISAPHAPELTFLRLRSLPKSE